jgi:hypothetical protein
MKKSRLLILSGLAFVGLGLLLVLAFALDLRAQVYDCEYLPGGMPDQGCYYFLQLPFYQ